MLFKQLYNWLRYKSLSPSFLFKNRLFVERQSQDKRAVVNIGLTFRNSHWTNYESGNTQFQFRWRVRKHITFLTSLVLTCIFMYYKHSYVPFLYASSTVTYVFWTGLDSADYASLFLIWVFLVTCAFITNTIQLSLFFNGLSRTSNFYQVSQDEYYGIESTDFSYSHRQPPMRVLDYQWVVYNWLVQQSRTKSEISSQSLFFSSTDHTRQILPVQLLSLLFKSIYQLNMVNANATQEVKTALTSMSLVQTLQPLTALPLNPGLFHMTVSHLPIRDSKETKSGHEYNLFSITGRSNLGAVSTLNLTETTWDQNRTQMARLTTPNSEKTDAAALDSVRSVRWLYKYSLLHRKFLITSNKMTAAKRFLNAGFYNTDISTSNPWNASYQQFQPRGDDLSALGRIFYSSQWREVQLAHLHRDFTNTTLRNLQLQLLKIYEPSYMWLNKRFTLLNSPTVGQFSLQFNTRSEEVNTPRIASRDVNFDSILQSCSPSLNLSSFVNPFFPLRGEEEFVIPVSYESEISNGGDFADKLWVLSPSFRTVTSYQVTVVTDITPGFEVTFEEHATVSTPLFRSTSLIEDALIRSTLTAPSTIFNF